MIIFTAHATYLFHALDLVLFDVLKTVKKAAHGNIGNDSVHNQIRKLLSAEKEVVQLFTTQHAFRKAGLTSDLMSRPARLVFNEEALRSNQRLSKIWNFVIFVD
jgi:hypothetical protein